MLKAVNHNDISSGYQQITFPVPDSLRLLRIADTSVGDDVGCFSLRKVCKETRSVHEIC